MLVRKLIVCVNNKYSRFSMASSGYQNCASPITSNVSDKVQSLTDSEVEFKRANRKADHYWEQV
jgi:hypothetical protein